MDKLVFDIGVDKGHDSQFYLKKNYKVIAVDANPNCINALIKNFPSYIESSSLIPLNYAISNQNDGNIPFYISNVSMWSSAIKDMALRQGASVLEVNVKTITLAKLIELHGTPYYCKIDIEGYDGVAVKSLYSVEKDKLPTFISSEVETLADLPTSMADKIIMWHERVEQLNELGYTSFQLIDQYSLTAVERGFNIYKKYCYDNFLLKKVINKSLRLASCLGSKFDLNSGYFSDTSGRFGEELTGTWHNYHDIKEIIAEHGENMTKAGISVMWSDIHATF